jgi:hypothetical protein
MGAILAPPQTSIIEALTDILSRAIFALGRWI